MLYTFFAYHAFHTIRRRTFRARAQTLPTELRHAGAADVGTGYRRLELATASLPLAPYLALRGTFSHGASTPAA